MASIRTTGFIIENVFESDVAANVRLPSCRRRGGRRPGGGNTSHVEKSPTKEKPSSPPA